MPPRPHKPCRKAGCRSLTTNSHGFCDAHVEYAKQSWSKADTERENSSKRGYNRRWRKARLTFLSSHPLCAECQRKGRIQEATVVDHIVPHRGDSVVFWDSSNWQPLCASCHSRKTARGE